MNTLILTHGDSDGICSGALALAACGKARIVFTNPISILEDVKHAEKYDRILVCDVAINICTAWQLKAEMSELSKETELTYIDHHPLPGGFKAPWLIHDTNACGSLLTFKHFSDALDRDMSRVAMYGAIGDYQDSTPLAMDLVKRWDKRSLYYQAGTLSQGIEMYRKNYSFKRDLVERLSRNVIPSEIRDLAANAIIASRLENKMRSRVEKSVMQMRNLSYVINPDGFLAKAAIYARIYGERHVGLAAEYREHDDVYDISVRADSNIDLNVLLNAAAVKFGGHGGGHPQAGGSRVPARHLSVFLSYLDRSLELVNAAENVNGANTGEAGGRVR